MKMKTTVSLWVAAGVAAALSLSACTTTDPNTGQTQLTGTTKGGLIGGAGGAALGAIAGGGQGAAIGAGIGAISGAAIGTAADKN